MAGSGTVTFTGTSMGRITMITRIITTRTGAAGSSGPTMARAASATIGTGAIVGRLIGERAEMKSGARQAPDFLSAAQKRCVLNSNS
jgi:hypothetical protein